MFKRFLSIVLAALIGAATPAVPAQAPSPAIERGLSVSAPAALPQLAQRLPDTIPPLYMLGGADTTPVASYNSATDPFPSASLSHSRGSLATMFDSTGKLTYAPNNLLTYSNTFSDAAWTKSSMTVASGATDPFGTSFAWTLTATANGALLYQLQSLAGPNAIPYVWMRRKTGSGIIYLRNANNVSIDVTAQVSSSWALVYVAPTAALGSNLFLISLATNGDQIEIYSAGYSAVTYETTPRLQDRISTGASAYYGPRIDYAPNTLAVKGLLIEPLAATNYCPYSSALSSWTAGGATLTNNTGATLDPSGLNTASILNPTGGTTASAFPANFSASASTEYTGSVFVKSNGSNFGGFGFYDVTNAVLYVAVFNLTTGANTFATAGVTALPSENIGNGWWRVSAKWTSAGSTATIIPVIYSWSTGGGGNATASDKLFFWGPQFEKNFEASSYIANPSTGTTTRAPDNVQFAGAAATALSSANFSAIVEGRIKTANASGVILIGGTSAFGVHLYSVSNTTARAYDGTRSQVYGDVTSGGAAWSAGSRAGVAASPSGTSLAMAGGTVGSYTNFATQSSGAALGRSVSSANPGTLWVKSFGIYNQRLSDATLQAKSVVGASYAANDNGLRFADNDNLPIHWRVAL